jgi:hypothetical protein
VLGVLTSPTVRGVSERDEVALAVRLDQSEYVTRVRWFDTRPSDQAVWEKGMYANQNVVTKLRHPVTLQRLTETFQTEPQETD